MPESETVKKVVVSVVRLATYEPAAIRSALEKLLLPLGTMEAVVKGAKSAVLKPNFLRPAAIETALTTHPEIIRAAAEAVFQAGVTDVVVTDSPGIGTAQKCAKKLGLAAKSDFFKVLNADESVECDSVEKDFSKIRLSKRMLDADVLINLAKVKTHAQMGMTLAVKNTFGAVVGMDKAQWHFRAGRDPLKFAGLIVRIHERIAPRLSILDGVIGMDGNGPGSGDPHPLGFLMASTNAHALDMVLCNTIGMDPMSVFTIAAAAQLGLLPDPSAVEIVGDSTDVLYPEKPWRPARPVTARMVGTRWLSPFLDRLLSVRPLIDPKLCTLCLRCIECCAAEAMSRKAGSGNHTGGIDIDKKKCISCFCCQEMCPAGAITVKTSAPARRLGLGIR